MGSGGGSKEGREEERRIEKKLGKKGKRKSRADLSGHSDFEIQSPYNNLYYLQSPGAFHLIKNTNALLHV